MVRSFLAALSTAFAAVTLALPASADTATQGAEGGFSVGADTGVSAEAETKDLPPAKERVEHSLRLGASLPFGDVEEGRSLSDDVNLRVPIWVDIGYRLNPSLYLALYGQMGIYAEGDRCEQRFPDQDVHCNAEDVRLGFEALFHFPLGGLDAWAGAGLGWEWLEQSARYIIEEDPENPLDDVLVLIEETQRGPALELQAGLDFSVDGALSAGPFAGYTLGAYLDRKVGCAVVQGCPERDTHAATAMHHWITAGVRGSYGP